MKYRDRASLRILGVLMLVVLLSGCATVSSIAKTCAPPTTDQREVVTELFERPDLTTAEAIAAAEGGKVAICVVTEIAKDILDQASHIHAAMTLGGEPLVVLRAQEWIKAHP